MCFSALLLSTKCMKTRRLNTQIVALSTEMHKWSVSLIKGKLYSLIDKNLIGELACVHIFVFQACYWRKILIFLPHFLTPQNANLNPHCSLILK